MWVRHGRLRAVLEVITILVLVIVFLASPTECHPGRASTENVVTAPNAKRSRWGVFGKFAKKFRGAKIQKTTMLEPTRDYDDPFLQDFDPDYSNVIGGSDTTQRTNASFDGGDQADEARIEALGQFREVQREGSASINSSENPHSYSLRPSDGQLQPSNTNNTPPQKHPRGRRVHWGDAQDFMKQVEAARAVAGLQSVQPPSASTYETVYSDNSIPSYDTTGTPSLGDTKDDEADFNRKPEKKSMKSVFSRNRKSVESRSDRELTTGSQKSPTKKVRGQLRKILHIGKKSRQSGSDRKLTTEPKEPPALDGDSKSLSSDEVEATSSSPAAVDLQSVQPPSASTYETVYDNSIQPYGNSIQPYDNSIQPYDTEGTPSLGDTKDDEADFNRKPEKKSMKSAFSRNRESVESRSDRELTTGSQKPPTKKVRGQLRKIFHIGKKSRQSGSDRKLTTEPKGPPALDGDSKSLSSDEVEAASSFPGAVGLQSVQLPSASRIEAAGGRNEIQFENEANSLSSENETVASDRRNSKKRRSIVSKVTKAVRRTTAFMRSKIAGTKPVEDNSTSKQNVTKIELLPFDAMKKFIYIRKGTAKAVDKDFLTTGNNFYDQLNKFIGKLPSKYSSRIWAKVLRVFGRTRSADQQMLSEVFHYNRRLTKELLKTLQIIGKKVLKKGLQEGNECLFELTGATAMESVIEALQVVELKETEKLSRKFSMDPNWKPCAQILLDFTEVAVKVSNKAKSNVHEANPNNNELKQKIDKYYNEMNETHERMAKAYKRMATATK